VQTTGFFGVKMGSQGVVGNPWGFESFRVRQRNNEWESGLAPVPLFLELGPWGSNDGHGNWDYLDLIFPVYSSDVGIPVRSSGRFRGGISPLIRFRLLRSGSLCGKPVPGQAGEILL